MATCAASEASPAARVSRSGTARRRREQRQRGEAKHVAWLTSMVQCCSSHHSGTAVGQVLAKLALLDARLAKTEAAVLGYGAASPPARPAPVVAAEEEAKGEVSPTVMAEVTANQAMEQDKGFEEDKEAQDKTLAFNAFKDPCISLNNKQVEPRKLDLDEEVASLDLCDELGDLRKKLATKEKEWAEHRAKMGQLLQEVDEANKA